MGRDLKQSSGDPLNAALALLASSEVHCGCDGSLLALLREDAPLYRGRGAVEAERLRAFVMAGLAERGLADTLVPFALQELETSIDPYGIAAAARVVRRASAVPQETASLLGKALDRVRQIDEIVDLENYPATPEFGGRTAVAETIEALAASPDGRSELRVLSRDAQAGPHLSSDMMNLVDEALGRIGGGACCAGPAALPVSGARPVARTLAGIRDVLLENQDGVRMTVGDLFGARPALLAFFYTRCMNPDKCSRTISQLGRVCDELGRRHRANDVLVAAISYDPAYDDPPRLRRYGDDREFPFAGFCQLLRTVGAFEPIQTALQLGVGYGQNTVNRHRLELMLVDRHGKVDEIAAGRLWDETTVADMLLAV
ncbi:hypothetical protein HB777_17030 [Mesorhizobium loti]|nr:hypothetical protein HB777_17030 [Mesorhizobium loti]